MTVQRARGLESSRIASRRPHKSGSAEHSRKAQLRSQADVRASVAVANGRLEWTLEIIAGLPNRPQSLVRKSVAQFDVCHRASLGRFPAEIDAGAVEHRDRGADH